MKVSYNVEIDARTLAGRESEESKVIKTFLAGTQPNMCLEYDTDEEAKQKAGLISQITKKLNENGKVVSYTKRNTKIYILRASA